MRPHPRTAPWLAAVVVTACSCTAAPAATPDPTRHSVDASAAAQALDRRKHSDARASKLPSGRTDHRTYAEVAADLTELETARPDVVERITLPHRTVRGLEVVGAEITHDVTAPDGKPVLLVTGAHHGDEWATVEVATEFATDLAERDGRDPRITSLLDHVRIIVVPVVNPDGFQLSRAGTVPGKRRNCRVADPAAESCATSPRAGVDLDRNYGVGWGGAGSSADRSADGYRGTAPFSEPETRNVRDLVSTRQVTLFTTLRAGAAAGGLPPPATDDEATSEAVARSLSDTARRPRAAPEAGGTAVEWFHHTTGGLGFDVGLAVDHRAPFATGVVDEYLGTEDRGAREVLTRAAEAAANRDHHSVLTGTSPAGAVLTLRRTTARAGTTPTDTLRSTTTSPGPVEWHVNPSPGQETWTVDCAREDGTVLQSGQVAVARGDRTRVDFAECAERWTG